MNKRQLRWIAILLAALWGLPANPCPADDICTFSAANGTVPPNIVILMENGAEMEQIVPHASFGPFLMPLALPLVDVVTNGGLGNGFFAANGYTFVKQGGTNYMVQVLADLTPDSSANGLAEDVADSLTWTINGRSLTLPVQRSTIFVDGVKDNNFASAFRYSKEYLNWLFFGPYAGDGSDLPKKSNFYYAKKAIFETARLTANRAYFGIYNFTANANGSTSVQPLGMVVNEPLAAEPADNVLNPAFVNNINNMSTVLYSPLAEGLARVAGYFGSPSSHVVGEACQKQFVIVVSPGVSSEDSSPPALSVPLVLSDVDGDGNPGPEPPAGIGEGMIQALPAAPVAIPVNQGGTTYLDDVAAYLYQNDIVDYSAGFQNVITYTVGLMSNEANRLFLINTSNNGNGNLNLYDPTDLDYGKYHFDAQNPQDLSVRLLAAVNNILTRTNTFTAPVVPVTRTTSGDRIYMALFKPLEANFWKGDVVKLGLNNGVIVQSDGVTPATHASGALKDDYDPYWQVSDWANPVSPLYVHNTGRDIYTYLGNSPYLREADPLLSNEFAVANTNLTVGTLGMPDADRYPDRLPADPDHPRAQLISYIRGADVFDEDEDNDTAENRDFIVGDVLHSEPLVVYYNAGKTMVYFGANDGMLHAVDDATGLESWAFIPPEQLHRLKDIVEGSEHQIFIDSSPKIFFKDVNKNGEVEPDDGDLVYLICGDRAGGTGFFALDVTDPEDPEFKWRINRDGAGGIMGLSNLMGAFVDNEQLTVTNRYGAADGTTTQFVYYKNKVRDFTIGSYVKSWTGLGTAGQYLWGQGTVVAIDEINGILELENVGGPCLAPAPLVCGAPVPFYPNDQLTVAERSATSNTTVFDFLRYSGALPGDFRVGDVITGATSGHQGTISAVTTLAPDFDVLELTGATGIFTPGEDLSLDTKVATTDSTLVDYLYFYNQAAAISVGDLLVGNDSGDSATVVSIPAANMLELSGSANTFVNNEKLVKNVHYADAASNQLTNALYYRGQLAAKHFDAGQKVVGRDSGAVAEIANIIELTPNTGILELFDIVGVFQNGEDLYNSTPPVMAVAGSDLLDVALLFDSQIQAFSADDIVLGAASLTAAQVVAEPVSGLLQLSIIPPGPALPVPLSPFVDGESLLVIVTVAQVDGTLHQQTGLLFTPDNGPLTPGDVISGNDSGATATVVSIPVAGSMLEVGGVAGAFVAGEKLVVNSQHGQAAASLVQNALGYYNQVAPFTIGTVVTGGQSQATATIDGVTSLTATSGYLRLSAIGGFFFDEEGLLGGNEVQAASCASYLFWGLRYADRTAALAAGQSIKGAVSNATVTINQNPSNQGLFPVPPPAVKVLTPTTGILALPHNPWSGAPPFFAPGEDLVDVVAVNAATANGTLDGSSLAFDNQTNPFAVGGFVTGLTSGATATVDWSAQIPAPTVVIPELAESWSEPQFGLVKTSDDDDDAGTAVFFIGGGYSATNAGGRAVLAINALTGSVVRKFSGHASMIYSIPSTVAALDTSGNGFIDKVYVGDLGGQVWRLGRFTDAAFTALPFPQMDENINNWSETLLFTEDLHTRKFFYQPSVTLEHGYDLVFLGSGDRDDACNPVSADRLYAMKDTHDTAVVLRESDVHFIDATAAVPDLAGVDTGWYIPLAAGEKALSEGLVFFKIFYITTFTPNNDPCTLGGIGKIYAVNHLTGGSTIYPERAKTIGSGIPSKPVLVIPDEPETPYLFISVADTDPSEPGDPGGAGIEKENPDFEIVNFKYLWWRDWTD